MVYEKIKKLAIAKGVSIYRVERDAGLSNGAISKWGKTANQTPSSESLNFKVSMEYLLEDEK